MTNLPRSRQTNIVVQEFETETLIYDLKSDKAYCLNETSAMIWQLCDGEHSVVEISQHLKQKLNHPITEDLIWLALYNFKKDNLLEESEQFEIDFNGLNRRQIIKKIGFSSMIALPMVLSVVAPVAGATASDPRNCYASIVGICMAAGTEACPVSCPLGTPIMITVYSPGDTTCSGGAIGSGSGGCPSGTVVFPYIIQ